MHTRRRCFLECHRFSYRKALNPRQLSSRFRDLQGLEDKNETCRKHVGLPTRWTAQQVFRTASCCESTAVQHVRVQPGSLLCLAEGSRQAWLLKMHASVDVCGSHCGALEARHGDVQRSSRQARHKTERIPHSCWWLSMGPPGPVLMLGAPTSRLSQLEYACPKQRFQLFNTSHESLTLGCFGFLGRWSF